MKFQLYRFMIALLFFIIQAIQFLFVLSITMQLVDQPSQEQKKKQLPSYKKLDSNVHVIETAQKIYYYCQCQKKDTVLYDRIVLVICQEIYKPITSIYYYLQKNQLTYSTKDLNSLIRKKSIELSAIKQICILEQKKMTFQFKIKEEQEWKIKFQNKQICERWFKLILEKRKQLAQKCERLQKQKQRQKQSQEQKLKQRQMKKKHKERKQQQKVQLVNEPRNQAQTEEEVYTSNNQINNFINNQLKSIKNIIKMRLSKSQLNQSDQHFYLTDKISMFKGNFQILGSLINQKQQQITVLKNEIQLQKAKMEQLQKQNNELNTSNFSLNSKIKLLQKDKQQIYQDNSSLQRQRIKLSENQETLQFTIDTLSKEKQMLEKAKIQQETAIIKQYEEKLQEYKLKEDNYNSNLHKLEQKIESFEKEKMEMKIQIEQMRLQSLFQGELLNNQNPHKQYIKTTIQTYRNLQVTQTKLIYKYDSNNKVNFHHYIDYHSNIVLIAKTRKGSLLAAYSKDSFSPTATSFSSCGIIMSLNKKLSFYVQPNKRSVSYDEYYIIFGNSEIRIKSQQQIIFSNFAIANSYFNANGFKVDALLAEGNQREVDLQTYEIYELKFKEQESL